MRLRTKHFIFLILAVLVHKTGVGQGGLPQIVIKDQDSGRPIAGVHVRNMQDPSIRVSDKDGIVRLEDWSLPFKIHLTHVAYEEREVTISEADLNGTDRFLIKMMPRMVMLDPVDITRQAPEVVYQREDLHVGAYHVNSDGLWVLVYDKPQLWHRQENAGQQLLRGARLHLLDALFQERAAYQMPTRVKGLHRDHLQRVIVEGEQKAWVAEARGDAIALGAMDTETLHNVVLPWKDTIPGHLLGSDLVETYPAFEHLAYDPITEEIRSICQVEDMHLMQLFRSQYKYMSGRDKVIAMDLALETGIDSEIIAGHMTNFHKDIYYRVPYAPLFVVNDTLCVFDHYREQIRKFDQQLAASGEVSITHHKERGWKNRLLQDPIKGHIYSLHARNSKTSLRPIDASTGEVGSPFTLTHPFPEEVKIFDGYVYYVYRPYGSLQNRTLYREELPRRQP